MNQAEVHKLIEDKLRERNVNIVARNAIDAFCKLFPPASVIWQILSGTKEKIDTARGAITLEVLLDMLIAIDKKLSKGALNLEEQKAFEVMLEGIRAQGNVTGLRARTSDPNLRALFTERDVKVILQDISAEGNVTGVDLTVDRELELKKKLEIKTDSVSVKFNPDVAKITFGKGFKSKDNQ